jgi:hypothetical protein
MLKCCLRRQFGLGWRKYRGERRVVTIVRAVIGLIALVNVAIGIGFLVDPLPLAAAFFIAPAESQGMATLRADFPGFFIGASIFALLAAVRGRAAPLQVPLTLLGLAFFGRCVSLVADGAGPHAVPPMAAEAVMLALLGAGYRVLDRRPA